MHNIHICESTGRVYYTRHRFLSCHILSFVLCSLSTQLDVDLVPYDRSPPALVGDIQGNLWEAALGLPIPHVHLDQSEHLRGLFLYQLVIRPDHWFLDDVLEGGGGKVKGRCQIWHCDNSVKFTLGHKKRRLQGPTIGSTLKAIYIWKCQFQTFKYK